MKQMMVMTGLLLAAVWNLRAASETNAPAAYAPDNRAQVEVCFVLDTTGSMGGLIEGAKRKIWSIANEIASAKPAPRVRFGLVGYRDRGDEYVTRSEKLTDDLDAVYAALQKFRADGGGDTAESVSEALQDAVSAMGWSTNRSVLKIVYLVGDAPPKQYKDGADWKRVCERAVRADLIINTVLCGGARDTEAVWREIAARAEGAFAAIPQDGNMAVVAAPQDEELAKLNVEIGRTMIAWGSDRDRRVTLAKQAASESAPATVAASRLAYNAKDRKTVQGGGELIDALKDGKLDLDSVPKDQLPPALRAMKPAELVQHVKELADKRAALQARVAALSKERDAYLEADRIQRAASGSGDSFDAEVGRSLREQAARKGIRYDTASVAR